jgi:hypothetical protein
VLSEVREAVIREWTNDKRKELANDRLVALLKRYEVSVESVLAEGSKP